MSNVQGHFQREKPLSVVSIESIDNCQYLTATVQVRTLAESSVALTTVTKYLISLLSRDRDREALYPDIK